MIETTITIMASTPESGWTEKQSTSPERRTRHHHFRAPSPQLNGSPMGLRHSTADSEGPWCKVIYDTAAPSSLQSPRGLLSIWRSMCCRLTRTVQRQNCRLTASICLSTRLLPTLAGLSTLSVPTISTTNTPRIANHHPEFPLQHPKLVLVYFLGSGNKHSPVAESGILFHLQCTLPLLDNCI